MPYKRIIVWLPSPMGDAVLCTPALKALRTHFNDSTICFFANLVAKTVLSPTQLCDEWIDYKSKNPVVIARQLRNCNADLIVLFKNSFLSAFSSYLAGVPQRAGYNRDFRRVLLTISIEPQRSANGKYKPLSMVTYYSKLVEVIGAQGQFALPELEIDPDAIRDVKAKVPQIFISHDPIVILVPGGAFGPSKCWPAQHYGQLANYLIEKYKASVIVSVAPNMFEQHIASQIEKSCRHKLINLGQVPLTLGQLKALFSNADLVISNDTGPRHIAIALKRKVISLFGPNDPEWTNTGYSGEIQIAAKLGCVPCNQPKCKFEELRCMRSISVATVCNAVDIQLKDYSPNQ